jgi:ribonuclease G
MDRGPMDRGPGFGMSRGPREPYGRGRESHYRSPREPRYEPPREEVEPIILPGESLAKYRDRPVRPPAEPSLPGEPRRGEVVAEVVGPEAPLAPAPAHEEIHEAEVHEAIPVPTAEPARQPGAPGETLAEPEAPSQPEAESPAMPETETELPASESAEAYPEASTLAEIQRTPVGDQVGLPPSVRDRIAGGVEWERGRGRSRGRGGRGRSRFGRDRGRGRGGRGGGPGRGPGREERGRPRMGGHARPSRGQPAISELLRAGQEIIVQIAKEQMGKKGARITSHVSLPGRYLVYMPTIEHVGVSRKIGTAEERARLRRLLLELKGNISGGFVVRTAASGSTEEDLRQDIDYLVKLWHDIRVRSEERSSPALLHHDLSLVERLLRDHFTQEYESVWIDSEEEYAKVVEFVAHFQPTLANRVKLYTKDAPIFDEMGVQREIDRALQPKVWLKSGGYIVINHTEALVAIDVNTGKYVGKGSTRLEDTIVKTNLDAIKEIVRQIRLRDLGGIIIIDFIDMEDRRNRHRVMAALEEALRADRSPSKVLGFNEFGLIAITRKRSRQSLERLLCQPCPTCVGTGMVKSIPTLCFEIQNEARKMAHTIDAPELTIRANPEIIKALKARESELVHELEEQTGKNIILQPDVTLHFEQYNIY